MCILKLIVSKACSVLVFLKFEIVLDVKQHANICADTSARNNIMIIAESNAYSEIQIIYDAPAKAWLRTIDVTHNILMQFYENCFRVIFVANLYFE